MGISINLPELNVKEEELKLLLAIKLLEEGAVSLGKAAETAGYSEKAFVEVLMEYCSRLRIGVDRKCL